MDKNGGTRVVRSWLVTAVCAATVAATGAVASIAAIGPSSPGASLAAAGSAAAGSAVARPAAASQVSPVRIYPGVRVVARNGAAPGGGLSPQQLRAAYQLPSVPTSAGPLTGAGQTIVIVDSFGSPTIAKDLQTFDHYFGLPDPPSFKVIQPAGKVSKFHGSNSNRVGWAWETTLDVEWSHVMAPGASIVMVATPTSENEGTTGFPQIVTAEKYVLRHKLGQVISQSFAATEQTFPSQAELRHLRSAYQLAAKDHVTVLAATGDEGATSYRYNMKDLYTTRAVSWPATDPLVTAVGGTQLDLRASGARRTPDVAWSDSGGGRSIVFGRPSYQYSARKITGGRRGVPDISMDASCASAVSVYGSFAGAGGWNTICGTSLATPLFAGIVALADQFAHHALGLINPAIYQIAIRHQRGIVDIRKGNNTYTFDQNGKTYTVRGFAARTGYDLVSGVGTVNAAYFVPELARLAG